MGIEPTPFKFKGYENQSPAEAWPPLHRLFGIAGNPATARTAVATLARK